jgi:acyl-[acyl-carrier-protein] desaturase
VPDRHPDTDLLCELEPVAERLLDRYLAMAKEWIPHEYVPWSLGRDFDTEPWTPDQPRLTGVAQAAFEVNLPSSRCHSMPVAATCWTGYTRA